MRKTAFAGLCILVFLISLLFRGTCLDRRPMHHDEANQAVKFGNLLERGEYRYDRADHHGPSLYYLTLPSAWLFSQTTFSSLDEKTLRLVPAFFGAAIFFLLIFVKDELGPDIVLCSGLLLTVSPVFVFYSRFYIQEMLLVFFLAGFLAAFWKCVKAPSLVWAVLAGLFSGMMYATKETSVIAFVAVLGSLGCVFLLGKKGEGKIHHGKVILLLLGGALAFFFVTWLFYSSFFQNSSGWLDSVRSFGSYFAKASHPDKHVHPWLYYLKLLFFAKYGHGPIWSEGFVLILAAFGSAAVFTKKFQEGRSLSFQKFIFFYTLICLLIFSSLSYKTPWNLLPFYIGMILLAGTGVSFLLRLSRKLFLRMGIMVLLGLGIFHLGFQAYRSAFVFFADPKNPYVYAQTGTDFKNLVRRIQDIASFHQDGQDMLVKVIAGPYETWPLPWSLRKFGRVGYWQNVESAGDLVGVPLIVTSMDNLEKLPPAFFDSYQQEFYGLRPEVPLAVFIRRDLWEDFLKNRNGKK